jgi:hypothetical protein
MTKGIEIDKRAARGRQGCSKTDGDFLQIKIYLYAGKQGRDRSPTFALYFF